MGVITGHARYVRKTVIVVGSSCGSVPRFQERDRVLGKFRPPSCSGCVILNVFFERGIGRGLRLWQITGKQAVQRRDICRTLNAGVSAESHDAASWTSYIPKE